MNIIISIYNTYDTTTFVQRRDNFSMSHFFWFISVCDMLSCVGLTSIKKNKAHDCNESIPHTCIVIFCLDFERLDLCKLYIYFTVNRSLC